MAEELNPIHVLKVEDGWMEVIHPPTCLFNPDAGPEDDPMYSCGVGWEVDEFGLDAFFRARLSYWVPPKFEYRPFLIDGRYFIERWIDTTRKHWAYGDADDSGLRLVYPEEGKL